MYRLITTLFCGFVLWSGMGHSVTCDMTDTCSSYFAVSKSEPAYLYHSDYQNEELCTEARKEIIKEREAENDWIKQRAINQGEKTYTKWLYIHQAKCFPIGHNANWGHER